MKNCRKHLSLWGVVILVAALLTMASPAAAQGNGNKNGTGLELQTTRLPAMTQGDTAWVSLSWYAAGDVDNVEVRATATKGATVSYPTNTGDYSGPYSEAGINAGGIDFTALKIALPSSARGNVKVDIAVTWEEEDSARSDSHTVQIHTEQYQGQDLAIITESVSVDAVAGGWVGVQFSGLAPRLDDFQLTVTDSAGLALEYPLGSYTSLHANSTLEDGETDVARVYIAPTESQAGTVQMQYQISYTNAGGPVTATATLAVVLDR